MRTSCRLSNVEETLARQKSKVLWLKKGEQCTTTSFKKLNCRRNQNSLRGIQLKDGSFSYNKDKIKEEFIGYFSQFVSTPDLDEVSEETLQI